MNNSIKLQPVPKCETPSPFKGVLLKKLKIGTDLHCESPLQPLLELKPNTDQLVFEGDTLTLRCRAPRVAVGAPNDSEDLPARVHVFWGWSKTILEPNSTQDIVYLDPTKIFQSIEIIDAHHLSDSGLLDSILKIPYVTRNHTGTWDCRLRSQQANLSRSIAVMIISDKTKYCLSTISSNNKGKYSWPRTIRSKTVRLQCIGDGPPNLYATYACNEAGVWHNLDTNQCPYIKETTKVLEQFSKVNMSIARGSVLESAKRLRNYTSYHSDGQRFNDPMDVVYIAKTITNYLDFVQEEKDLGSMLMDIVSQVMELDGKLLQVAQYLDSSAIKLVNATEEAASFTPSQQAQKENVALELFKIRTDSFNGITCTWFKSATDDSASRTFQCNSANNGEGIGIHERHIDAGIQIPANLLATPLNSQSMLSQKLLVSVFKDSKLFPQNRTQNNFEVTSCVIGAKILNRPVGNLTDPIFIMLRAAPFHNELSFPRPVWWDPEMNAGTGGWSLQGCHFSQLQQGLLVFACNRLGYYGLLQNVRYLNDFANEFAGARFRLSPPALYVGGIILFICAWINIVTYIAYGQSIQMARRAKHSLINTWLAMSGLTFVFTMGIYQTEDYKVCQCIGIGIHYFSLCVILWICVGVSNMYKRISRNERNISLPTDDMPKAGRKPILGLYLVGWGIALIICGISGSVNMREYASYSYCFLKSGPALSAVFVPAFILIGFLAILFVCIRCSIQTPEDIGHMSEGTQGTENVDLDLLEPNCAVDRYRSISISTPTTSTQEDMEHTNGTQLKAHVIVLFLYVVTWVSGSVSVATPFADRILYEEEVFSIIYAISATVLGFFLIFFYCIARSDVRQQWSMLSCRNFSKRQCCRSRSVSDAKEHNNIPPVSYRQTTATMHSISRSNSQSSKNRGPSANGSHTLKGAVDLNMHGTLNRNDMSSQCHNKMNGNVNLVLLHRQQFLHNSVVTQSGSEGGPDVFYNPNQINVARKFFKKQKRLQKRNNFEIHRHRDMDCMSEVSSIMSFPRRPNGMSLFSSEASKVNNTNIHMDKKNLLDNASSGGASGGCSSFRKDQRQQNSNPNILSDSCNESDLIMDAERFVIGAENLRALTAKRAKVNNTPPIVANIYTNVPETSQPQHEIVTMKADDKYAKTTFNDADRSEQQFGTMRAEDKFKKSVATSSSSDRDRFLIGEERTLEKNNLGSPMQMSETPHYVNEDFRNISTKNNEESEIDGSPYKPTLLEFNSNSMTLSLNSPILAMNTVGLPMATSSPNRSMHTDTSNISATSPDDHSTETQILLHLNKDDEYISSALEISMPHRMINESGDNDQFMLNDPCLKSKSMNDLIDPDQDDACQLLFDCQTRSISCTNILVRENICDEDDGAGDCLAMHPSDEIVSSSPILFSPSLCDINDIELVAGSSAQRQTLHQSPFQQRRRLVNLESTPVGSETNLFFTPEKIFNPIRRNFASSPTSESEINYQNSELSIRSHELYAPQPLDLDLNLTLTGEEAAHYPYQASEISDLDDDDDDEDDDRDPYDNCANECLLGPNHDRRRSNGDGIIDDANDDDEDDILNDSQSSIDELYQQITRRSISDDSPFVGPVASGSGTLAGGRMRVDGFVVNEAEEDSSQCSVVSYREAAVGHS